MTTPGAGTARRRPSLVLVTIGVGVLIAALLIGAGALLAAHTPRDGFIAIGAVGAGMSTFLLGPLTLGSLRAYWDVSGSAEARQYFRRAVLIIVGVELLGAAAIVVASLLGRIDAIVPLTLIGAGAVLTAVAPLVGRAVFRGAPPQSPPTPWIPISPREVRTRIVATSATFFGLLVVGAIGLGILSSATGGDLPFGIAILYAVDLAAIVAAVVCVFSTIGWTRRVRELFGRDPIRLRRIAKVVLGKTPDDLQGDDAVVAARYAGTISLTMAFQLAYMVLLYIGLGMQQVASIASGTLGMLPVVLLCLFALLLVVIVPWQAIQLRKVRRYAAAHEHQLAGAAA